MAEHYGLRDAEKELGIAPYTITRINKRHPLPEPTVIIDGRPGWTIDVLREWYEQRPTHGGDRHSKEFKERRER